MEQAQALDWLLCGPVRHSGQRAGNIDVAPYSVWHSVNTVFYWMVHVPPLLILLLCRCWLLVWLHRPRVSLCGAEGAPAIGKLRTISSAMLCFAAWCIKHTHRCSVSVLLAFTIALLIRCRQAVPPGTAMYGSVSLRAWLSDNVFHILMLWMCK